MGAVVLVTGGARNGKSLFAETLATGLGACVTYVATAEVSDAEMDARVARHWARRLASWITREAPHDLRTALAGLDQQVDVVLVDCLAVWASNRLLALGDPEQGSWWAAVEALDRTLADEVGKAVIVLAADHGVARAGVSAYPQEVSAQMVQNLLAGGAAINVLARRAGARVVVADLGVAADIPPHSTLVRKKIGYDTRNLADGPAMTLEETFAASTAGIESSTRR